MSPLPITSLFEGFSVLDCTTPRVHFAGVMGGEGLPAVNGSLPPGWNPAR